MLVLQKVFDDNTITAVHAGIQSSYLRPLLDRPVARD